MTAATRKILGPLNRVEGDLEVKVEVAEGKVTQAWVNSPLFRGFEKILVGKVPTDALVYTPRICGICSVSQSVAAATALADLMDMRIARNGQLAINLLLACENMADHLSHFYLFFMPDFARPGYANQEWHQDITKRFKAQTGEANNQVLPARSAFLQMTGILAGKWPHSLSIQPGGTSKPINSSEQFRLQSIITTFRHFLETTLFGDKLENVSALKTAEELDAWQCAHPNSDFGRFLSLAKQLHLQHLGRATDHFLSYGAYLLEESHVLRPGSVSFNGRVGQFAELDERFITEDSSNAWLNSEPTPLHPFQGMTEPDVDQDGYTWCKAPRLSGQTVEVGALARQVVNGHPLLLDLVSQQGASVHSRVVARLLELAILLPQMESWCQQITPGEIFCEHGALPQSGQGVGMVEAARGSLGHWIQVKEGKVHNYQIIAPTTWNFSPRDSNATPGALEQALEGSEVTGSIDDALAVQHIIRSFDPCMVCTVH